MIKLELLYKTKIKKKAKQSIVLCKNKSFAQLEKILH